MAETVRIDPASHAALLRIAKKSGIPLGEALARAVRRYDFELKVAEMSADYASLRADPKAWAEEERERALRDNTNLDGLADDPAHADVTRSKPPRRTQSAARKRRSA